MKNLSVFQVMLLGFFGLAALVGVFVFATQTNTNTSSPDSIGSVVIWGTMPKTVVDTLLVAATKDDQAFKDVSYVEKAETALPAELAAAIATGSGPDLVLASHEELYALRKFLLPISTEALPLNTFSSAFVGGAALFITPMQDGYYGIPFAVDPLVLFYNRAVLASAGVPKPPATWESLTGLVPTVAVLTPTKQVTRGLIGLGTYNNVRNARGILSSLFLQTGIPIVREQGAQRQVNLSGRSEVESSTGRTVLGFYTQFADPAKVSYTWNASLPDSRTLFLRGDLALYVGYLSESAFLKDANPNLDFAVAQLPQPGTAKDKAAYGLLYASMIPRGSQNATGAYRVAARFSTVELQTLAAGLVGVAPAALSALEVLPQDPGLSVGYEQALYTKGWLSPLPRDTDEVFSGMITSVISGRLTLDSALSSAANALSALLQN